MPPSTNSSIIIVGAGVFGLTTALHLSQAGYKNVHVFDKQPYHLNAYAFSAGCDAASADENKDHNLSTGTDLPHGLSVNDKLWVNCGFLRIASDYDSHETETQKNFPDHIRHTQYRITDTQRVRDALRDGIPRTKLDPFTREPRGLQTDGVLDTTAGFVLASKACTYALHLCQKAGVILHLGSEEGTFTSYIQNGPTISGIITADGKTHLADLVVIACGGWTPSLVPQVDRLLETTAGSVVTIKLPVDRQDLWDKYGPVNFPVWSWQMNGYSRGTSNGGLYGFPRTVDSLVKFGFRGAKWTNYTHHTQEPGRTISYPKTDVEEVPQRALDVVQEFCRENMPDLLELELQRGRLCWYTDSVDESFLIDYVPGVEGLFVASGGSGHGFKFLPVLGKHVVDVIEGKSTGYTKLFAWRNVPEGKTNGLEEGPDGWRTLDKQTFAGKKDWGL